MLTASRAVRLASVLLLGVGWLGVAVRGQEDAGSPPEYQCAPGQEWTLKVAEPGVVAALMTAPTGAVLRDGVIRWAPDAIQKGIHRFKVRVQGTDGTAFRRFAVEVRAGQDVSQNAGLVAGLQLPDGLLVRAYGAATGPEPIFGTASDGSLMMLAGRALYTFAGKNLAQAGQQELPYVYTAFYARDSYLVCARGDAIDIVDAKTLKPLGSVSVHDGSVVQVVKHPGFAAGYALLTGPAFGGTVEDLAQRKVCLFDEKRLVLHAVPRLMGDALAVAPDGSRLLVGINRKRLRSDVLLMSSSFVVPLTQHVDWIPCHLLAYDVRTGWPTFVQSHRQPARGCSAVDICGLVYAVPRGFISSDDPKQTDCPCFPVYQVQDIGALQARIPLPGFEEWAVVHPFLPMGGYTAKDGKVMISRRSPAVPVELWHRPDSGTTLHGLVFSPAGEHLVAWWQRENRVTVQAFPLPLDPQEQETVTRMRSTLRQLMSQPVPKNLGPEIPLAPLPPLAPAWADRIQGGPLAAERLVARLRSCAVRVETLSGSGSGVMISRGGYVLTSGVVLPPAGPILVHMAGVAAPVQMRIVPRQTDSPLVLLAPVDPGSFREPAKSAVVPVVTTRPDAGVDCLLLGYEGNDDTGGWTVAPVVGRTVRALKDSADLWVLSGTLTASGLGGAVFDAGGDLIGMVVQVGADGSLAVTGAHIAAFLKESGQTKE